MIDLSKLDRPPAGFGSCSTCAYRERGTSAICFACASEEIESPAPRHCRVCARALPGSGACTNPICGWEDREFSRVWAISMRTGEMERAISRYKYDGRWGWAAIFARILVGFLEEHRAEFRSFDLIVPSPTFTGRGGRKRDHIGDIVGAAMIEEPLAWPFELGLITKTAATERLAGRTWTERRTIAEGPLRDALRVPRPATVSGKRILVVDDVFTEGFTIREVARALRLAGASEVAEVVLARQPWRGG